MTPACTGHLNFMCQPYSSLAYCLKFRHRRHMWYNMAEESENFIKGYMTSVPACIYCTQIYFGIVFEVLSVLYFFSVCIYLWEHTYAHMKGNALLLTNDISALYHFTRTGAWACLCLPLRDLSFVPLRVLQGVVRFSAASVSFNEAFRLWPEAMWRLL